MRIQNGEVIAELSQLVVKAETKLQKVAVELVNMHEAIMRDNEDFVCTTCIMTADKIRTLLYEIEEAGLAKILEEAYENNGF